MSEKDISTEVYLKCKRIYWGMRCGPKHTNYDEGHLLWIKFGVKKPPNEGWMTIDRKSFTDWNTDLTFDELNQYNARIWREIG